MQTRSQLRGRTLAPSQVKTFGARGGEGCVPLALEHKVYDPLLSLILGDHIRTRLKYFLSDISLKTIL